MSEIKERVRIEEIDFNLRQARGLTRKAFNRSYGNKAINGTDKPTYWNLNQDKADRIWSALQEEVLKYKESIRLPAKETAEPKKKTVKKVKADK